MKKNTLLVSVLTLALLQACGGDGDDNNVTPPPSGGDGGGAVTPPSGGDEGDAVTPPSGGDEGGAVTPPSGGDGGGGDQGGVQAAFVPSDLARYMLFYQNGSSNGARVNAEQAADGGITSLGGYSLSDGAIKDMAGDASYALGRWVSGTVTSPTGSSQITGADAGSYHYAVYNIPASFPATGAYACAQQTATTPTRVNGSGADTGSVDGAANLSFDSTGAHLSGAMTVTVGGENVTVSLPASIASPTSLGISGQFLASGAGAGVQVIVADGGYALMAAYAAQLANGALYHGIARMSCSAN
jgi:hypothetical protein